LLINRYVSNEELVCLIKNTRIVICPYIDATQSGVVMTAFAFNKPVIGTNVGGMKEVVVDGFTGKLVPPKDPNQLSIAIVDLLKNNSLRKYLESNIKQLGVKSKFSWSNIAEQTIQVYKKSTT
jgi:glycosyltransferase involved in cell wall biosynthesis